MTVALWEAAKALIDVYMVQPMLISHHSAASTKCLLAGLAAPSDYIRHFAQFELAHLAVTAPDRRREIFADMSTPSTAWAELWRTEMVLLGKSYQALRTGGLPAVSTSVASSGAPAASASGPTSDGPTQKHLVPKSDPAIFKHAPKTMYCHRGRSRAHNRLRLWRRRPLARPRRLLRRSPRSLRRSRRLARRRLSLRRGSTRRRPLPPRCWRRSAATRSRSGGPCTAVCRVKCGRPSRATLLRSGRL
jgi:hypothetical protein